MTSKGEGKVEAWIRGEKEMDYKGGTENEREMHRESLISIVYTELICGVDWEEGTREEEIRKVAANIVDKISDRLTSEASS